MDNFEKTLRDIKKLLVIQNRQLSSITLLMISDGRFSTPDKENLFKKWLETIQREQLKVAKIANNE